MAMAGDGSATMAATTVSAAFAPEYPKQALYDRMLLSAERGRIDLGEPSHDGERGSCGLAASHGRRRFTYTDLTGDASRRQILNELYERAS
jgi:hypothetical protein